VKIRLRSCVAVACLLAACVPPGGPAARPPAEPARGGGSQELVPAGFGSLRQEEITLTLTVGSVQVKVTPLAESVIRLTAPDTYQRLSGAVARLAEADRSGRQAVLVSLYTEAPGGEELEPRTLVLTSRGRTYRPQLVRGLTPGWGSARIEQRRLEQALYLYDEDLELDLDLAVEIGGVTDTRWGSMLPRLEAERSRVRARAGGGVSPRGRTF